MNNMLADLTFYRAQRRTLMLRKLFSSLTAQTAKRTDEKQQSSSLALRNQQAERILKEYGNSILRFSYTYVHNLPDAEDILQETLIRFLQHGPHFPSPAQEKAWLMKVAANLSKNKLQYNAVRAADELKDTLAAEEKEPLSQLWEAVKSLESPYREVIHLHYYEGYSGKEIAGMLGRRESTIRSDLLRGRMKLKELLKEAYDFE